MVYCAAPYAAHNQLVLPCEAVHPLQGSGGRRADRFEVLDPCHATPCPATPAHAMHVRSLFLIFPPVARPMEKVEMK